MAPRPGDQLLGGPRGVVPAEPERNGRCGSRRRGGVAKAAGAGGRRGIKGQGGGTLGESCAGQVTVLRALGPLVASCLPVRALGLV
jgi:hypothetical protein